MQFLYKLPGYMLLLFGGFCLSWGGFIVRSFETSNAWEILLLRSFFFFLGVTTFLIITYKNKTITLNLALNYGSKEEIINAFKHLSIKKGLKITINNFENHLYTKNIPDPEILIRTGGTKRLSNFLLWQLAYTEIFFIDKLWPDFNERDFNNIIKKFYNIKRNFGKI